MYKYITFSVFMVLLVLFSCKEQKVNVPPKTNAGNAESLSIVYIDLDTLLEKYDLYKEKKEQLESQSKSAEQALGGKIDAFQKRAQKFQTEVMEIQQKANSIAPVELKKLEEKFGKQQESLAREEDALVKQRESVAIELEKKLLETQNEIQKTLDEYLAKIAKEKGYALILKKGNLGGVMYGDEGLDITLETAEALNKEYKANKK